MFIFPHDRVILVSKEMKEKRVKPDLRYVKLSYLFGCKTFHSKVLSDSSHLKGKYPANLLSFLKPKNACLSSESTK